MSKTARYVTALLLSIFGPIAFLYAPFLTRTIKSGGSKMESVNLMNDFFPEIDRFTRYSDELAAASIFLMLVLFICFLMIIFSAVRSKGGVMTTSILGLVFGGILLAALLSVCQEMSSDYARVDVGIGVWILLIVFVTNLSLAASEKKEVATVPLPPYPTYHHDPYGRSTTYGAPYGGTTYGAAPYGTDPRNTNSYGTAPYGGTSPAGGYLNQTANTAGSNQQQSEPDDLVSNWTEF